MDELSMIKRGDHVQNFHVHKLERGRKYTSPIALTVDKKCPKMMIYKSPMRM